MGWEILLHPFLDSEICKQMLVASELIYLSLKPKGPAVLHGERQHPTIDHHYYFTLEKIQGICVGNDKAKFSLFVNKMIVQLKGPR